MTGLTLADAESALHQHFGYPAFRPGQANAVRSVLSGRDTLVVLPTGGGKSLCYQVPALVLPGLTVVVSPLISLMKDQVDALTARGLPAAFINSTLTSAQTSERFARAQRGELKLLYVAPERFDQGTTAARLKAIGVSLLAVDEAHCISEWGHDFRPSYLRMAAVREALGAPPTIALTATATPEVRTDIAAQLKLRDPEVIITGFDRTNLSYHVVPAKNEREKDAAMVSAIKDYEGLAIVYASTRRAVERVAGVLERARIPSVAYHAGLDDAHRHAVQDAFMREEVRAIVATNAFGMGIDKPNVRLVVHHAMPGTLEAYYQEAGRAGRDGNPSTCVLLHSFPDRFTHEFFIKSAYPERALVERVFKAVRASSDADISPDAIASRMSGKVNAREVEGALRLLAKHEVLDAELPSRSRVSVRLLATPERIRRELTDAEMERELLRALWRVAGDKLNEGAIVDLDGLPPGFGGASGALPMLEALERRQFVMVTKQGGGTRTSRNADRRLDAIPWVTLDRRRRADMAKLDAMQKYAYTNGCRRGFVLKYFGDPAARERCSSCDNCLGVRRAAPSDDEVPKKNRKRARKAEPRDWRSDEAADGLPAIGKQESALFEALRALRTSIAREERVPPYVVFPDRTLAELAVRRPGTARAFADIRGVGPMKLERYGERFLQVIRQAAETEAA